MKSLDSCILYTQDNALAEKVNGALCLNNVVHHINSSEQLEKKLQQQNTAILLFDLRADNTRNLLPWIIKELPHILIIVLADPDSIPAREALDLGVYAVEPLVITANSLRTLVARAHQYLRLIKENTLLKKIHTENIATTTSNTTNNTADIITGIPTQFFKAFRNFKDIKTMLEDMLEGISAYAGIARIGIFAITNSDNCYRLIAGNKCLENVYNITVPVNGNIVQWMTLHAHIISRHGLAISTDPVERLQQEEWLDMLGADAIIPLYGRKQIIGWIFVGRKTTGAGLLPDDLETLSMLGDYVSAMLENALLYEKLSLQQDLTDTVFNSVPVGIVVTDAKGIITWINKAVKNMFNIDTDDIPGNPVETVSIKLADQLNRCLRGLEQEEKTNWMDSDTQKQFSTVTRRLTKDGICNGAVALINDFTREHNLKKEERRMARAIFWTDLAAAISHEVRNPLVAISTFAQLLPECYDDDEFRNDFSNLVSKEISRLEAMVDQINEFANYPESEYSILPIKNIVEKAVKLAHERMPDSKAVIEKNISLNTRSNIYGDANHLTDAIAHLLVNSMEALVEIESPVIKINVTEISGDVRKPVMLICIRDNGNGISDEIIDKIFSPFFSTKNRGIGLGLPIVKRTMEDHHGDIYINTNTKGCEVTLSLPLV